MMVMIMMTVTMMTPENADRVVPETLVLFFGEKKNSDPTKSSAQVNWFVLNLLCDGFSRHLCCECILMKITDTGGDCD